MNTRKARGFSKLGWWCLQAEVYQSVHHCELGHIMDRDASWRLDISERTATVGPTNYSSREAHVILCAQKALASQAEAEGPKA